MTLDEVWGTIDSALDIESIEIRRLKSDSGDWYAKITYAVSREFNEWAVNWGATWTTTDYMDRFGQTPADALMNALEAIETTK